METVRTTLVSAKTVVLTTRNTIWARRCHVLTNKRNYWRNGNYDDFYCFFPILSTHVARLEGFRRIDGFECFVVVHTSGHVIVLVAHWSFGSRYALFDFVENNEWTPNVNISYSQTPLNRVLLKRFFNIKIIIIVQKKCETVKWKDLVPHLVDICWYMFNILC